MITFFKPKLFKKNITIRVTFFAYQNRDKAIEKIRKITEGELVIEQVTSAYSYKKTILKNNRKIEFNVVNAAMSSLGMRTHFVFIDEGILLNPEYKEIYRNVINPTLVIPSHILKNGVNKDEIVKKFLY